jgi:hypothetical protein
MRSYRVCVLVAAVALVTTQCGSASAPVAAPGDAGDAGSLPVPPPSGPCQSTAAVSLLGTWQTTEIGPGGPNGATPTPITITRVLCGTETGGTDTYTEDGPGSPGPGCSTTAKTVDGWTWASGQDLVFYGIGAAGFFDVSGCQDASQNYHIDVNDGQHCNDPSCEEHYQVLQLTQTQLVLRQLQAFPLDAGNDPGETWTRK